MASAAAAKKWPRPSQSRAGSSPTSRRYASWTRAVAWSVWPGVSAGQPGGGELAQLVVDEREQLGGGLGVALLDGGQDVGDVGHAAKHTPAEDEPRPETSYRPSIRHRTLTLEETLVVVMAEFGRTPKIGQITSGAARRKNNGRDHWPYCYTVLFADGGIPGGAVYGASDKFAAHPSSNAVTPEDIAATIYTALGHDPTLELHDPQDKPYTLCTGKPIGTFL